jgi:hypothetical protein
LSAAVPRALQNSWTRSPARTPDCDGRPRMRMIDGFNEGWIDFEGNEADIVKDEVELETVLQALVSGPQ